jgi:hypothetical protein
LFSVALRLRIAGIAIIVSTSAFDIQFSSHRFDLSYSHALFAMDNSNFYEQALALAKSAVEADTKSVLRVQIAGMKKANRTHLFFSPHRTKPPSPSAHTVDDLQKIMQPHSHYTPRRLIGSSAVLSVCFAAARSVVPHVNNGCVLMTLGLI